MTVTKQQQLEWLAKECDEWPFILDDICMSSESVGDVSYAVGSHRIAKQEWQQEREKMQKKQDNSWHERGELPPVGGECEALYRGEWVPVIVIGIDSSGYCVFEVPECMNDEPPYDGIREQANFRPLRTEREKAIDDLTDLISACSFAPVKIQAEKIYDAGYRKEQTK